MSVVQCSLFTVHRFLPSFLTFPLPLPRQVAFVCPTFIVQCSSFTVLPPAVPGSEIRTYPHCPRPRSIGRRSESPNSNRICSRRVPLASPTGPCYRGVPLASIVGQCILATRNSHFCVLPFAFCVCLPFPLRRNARTLSRVSLGLRAAARKTFFGSESSRSPVQS